MAAWTLLRMEAFAKYIYIFLKVKILCFSIIQKLFLTKNKNIVVNSLGLRANAEQPRSKRANATKIMPCMAAFAMLSDGSRWRNHHNRGPIVKIGTSVIGKTKVRAANGRLNFALRF
jgi:hypothetical protein